MNPARTTLTLAVIAAMAVPVAAAATSPDLPASPTTRAQSLPLLGTWQITVDPAPPGPAGQPSFESILAFGASHVVSEATANAATSAGLGSWKRVGASKYEMRFQKYRFDSTGVYVGKTVIDQTLTVTSHNTCRATAVTQVLSPTGQVVAQFSSTSTGRRFPA